MLTPGCGKAGLWRTGIPGTYQSQQDEARAAKRGIWAGTLRPRNNGDKATGEFVGTAAVDRYRMHCDADL
jgi:hypothetical protein